jgi:hypothetical protein
MQAKKSKKFKQKIPVYSSTFNTPINDVIVEDLNGRVGSVQERYCKSCRLFYMAYRNGQFANVKELIKETKDQN